MYATGAQKCFTYMGYYANAFAREAVRDVERLTHPMPQGDGYWAEVNERVKRVAFAIISIPLAAVLCIPAMSCYAIAACMGEGRLELIEPQSPSPFWQKRDVKVLSLNACFQNPWSPLTGGVVPPFEPVANCASRIAAIVNAIAKEDPTIVLGQEFEDIGAQGKFIELMLEKDYPYFVRDLGSSDPICNNSGLVVASKVPLQNIEFVPYPSEDRAGLAKWSKQGALTFTTLLGGKDFRFVNVHLNYPGISEENQQARNRQLQRHVIPLLRRGPSVLFGDLNFDTSKVSKVDSGLQQFTNALEGLVTCTDEGKHTLRGKDRNPGGQPCAECEERIDGLIYDPNQVRVDTCEVKPLRLHQQLLSDHYATVATIYMKG